MAASHGQLTTFSGNPDDWEAFIEQLESYFVANDITAAGKKRGILLSSCGTAAYKTIRSIVAPTKPTEIAYNDLTARVKAHFAPKPSAIVQRYKFNTCTRNQGESVASYVSRLRALTPFCDFGDTLDNMLRDRLVCGINHEQLQRRLLAEPNLRFAKAMEIAQTFESAMQDARRFQEGAKEPLPIQVHAVQMKRTAATSPPSKNQCYRCGGNHKASSCTYKESTCHHCKKKGHLAKMCRSRQDASSSKGTFKGMHQVMLDDDETEDVYKMYNLPGPQTNPIQVMVSIEGQDVLMEVDTGASLSVVSEMTYKSMSSAPPLQSTRAKLCTYTGESLGVLGSISVSVCHNQQQKQLSLLVVSGDGPSLLGRDWLTQLQLDWTAIHQLCTPDELQAVLDRHSEVFKDELGTLQGKTVKLHIDSAVQPKFFKHRPVPISQKHKVEVELKRLQDASVIEPVQFSDWATPIVPVIKHDGSLRICGDYKVTVNTALKPEVYPLPRIDELFTALAGGERFSKLDLSHAYQQLVLDEESQKLVTINTHKGLFKYNRLPFGVTTAPSIFQRVMEHLLRDLNFVTVYLDDILVTGKTTAEHLANLDEVLSRLEEAGMRLKQSKCKFLLSEVEYLGHKITKNGLKPSDAKLEAVSKAPVPKNVSELKAFLGLVNYYGKFLSHLSTTLSPLHNLLQKGTRFQWKEQHQKAFDTVRSQLISSELLVHYDSDLELVLSCDASPYGVGAVLAHRFRDGTERPIAYASRTLAPAEKRYCQLDKEALAIIFGLKKFHQFLFGRHFVIFTDHKPLSHLFDSTRAVPQLASARIQRWALTLLAYSYTLEYKSGQLNSNADALSRLPLPITPVNVPMPADTIHLLEQLNSTPVTATLIKKWTAQNPILAKVKNLVLKGWTIPPKDKELRPYFNKRTELSVESGCILRGVRVLVPPQGREKVLELLHEAHPGMERMKQLARSYVWWPGIDSAIEEKVKSCYACQSSRNSPQVAPLHPWEWPDKPWTRVHIDYAGPFMNRMFLIMVDAHTKWLEVHVTQSSTAAVTIQKLQQTFATLGLPETLVSDNGSAFTSLEFQRFMKQNGITHVKTSPYHPSSNGLAERAVQTFKTAMKRMSGGSVENKVSRFLFKYRVTPHSTTGVPPAELMFGRQLRTTLDLLQPSIGQNVRWSQAKQKEGHDAHSKNRQFKEGDTVFVKCFSKADTWLAGVIDRKQGPVSFRVVLDDDRVVRRHLDHIRARDCVERTDNDNTDIVEVLPLPVSEPEDEVLEFSHSTTSDGTSAPLRRSARLSRRPSRLIEETNQ